MPNYRRAHRPGGMFFFTLVTERRVPILCTDLGRACLRAAFCETRTRWPFTVEAIVLLPEHLHTIWSLPDGDADFSTRWSFLKRTFVDSWLGHGGWEQPVSAARRRRRRRGVLQARFWEHTVRDERDFVRHLDYVHYNPVKHGQVTCPHAWPYSTFRDWVGRKAYAWNWQCVCTGARFGPLGFEDLEETAME